MDLQTLQDISDNIKDVFDTQFEYSNTNLVPNYEDTNLTYERGQIKKGKRIKTCVLYIDIRNSVNLSKESPREFIGQLYTGFVKAMLLVADYHGGYVRNIIGDRVMVVFPTYDCCTSAIECAISMNTVAHHIIAVHAGVRTFKCGIGIDYGMMRVLKTGIVKQGKDRTSYKNLVWTGRAANIASRLTDLANKAIQQITYKVRYQPPRRRKLIRFTPSSPLYYIPSPVEEEYTPESFSQQIGWTEQSGLQFSKGTILNITKIEKEISYKPILITGSVFSGLVEENAEHESIAKGFWEEQKIGVKDYDGKVYGCNLTWKSANKIQY
ncbi:adenylate/guanylate cyclase domain-containing protein [Xanthocytophaga agilis]|uniref:Adenylate/guanylate cyclase domain-containing protein n=1 Tax=Xanthocytophaga agilis TaxID=3048010 RepID=A0AAE3R8A9_9BACT|nr:adenylate/guanylate cyclase domain-containing protein [Xanthocytophaga agilis]MDJ1505521.1 adenylate/guanylate cyclase domain-containing protein [Xanthocytophaga agilis]